MHTKDLCMVLGNRLGMSCKDAEAIFRVMLNVIEDQLLEGKEVNLVKFGKLIPIIIPPQKRKDTFSGNKKTVDCDGKILVKFKHFRASRLRMFKKSTLAQVQSKK